MTLKEKLERFKKSEQENTELDWENYKTIWKGHITDLYNKIMYKWFDDYSENKLMDFSVTPTARIDPYIGEYITAILEITLPNHKYIVLEPLSGITAEYDGRLDLYMRGNVYKKVSILRKLTDENTCEWIVAKSHNINEHYKLDKVQLEQLIDQWLQ